MQATPLKDFRPISERVVIKRESAAEELNGFYIPENARQLVNRGCVVAVATDVKDVQVGDYVMFGKYDGTTDGKGVNIEGQEYLIMKENQIWGVLTND